MPGPVKIARADNPHGNYVATTDACAACHRTHTGLGSPILFTTDQGDDFCYNCHGGGGGGKAVSTHANRDFAGAQEGSFKLACVQCHDPHGSKNL